MRLNKLCVFILLLVASMILAACVGVPAAPGADSASETSVDEPTAEVIEIEYWQYFYETRVGAMDQLIQKFEAENPDIKVIHNSDIPYADFRDKIAASAPANVAVAGEHRSALVDWCASS